MQSRQRKWNRVSLRAVIAALLAVTCAWVDARASDIGLTNYYHSVWTIKDGAPAAITTMAQTRDGWLWLGTPSGLYRFDGIRFAKFASTDGSALLSSNISNLYAPPDGSLIVGYMAGGLSVIAQDKVTHLATRTAMGSVRQTELDIDGSLWAATMSGLYHYQRGRLERVDAARGFPAYVAMSIVLDPYGRLWASSAEHQYVLDRSTGKFVLGGLPGGAMDLIRSPDGRVWRIQDGAFTALPLPPGARLQSQAAWRAPSGTGALFDHDGNYWETSCPVGLCRSGAASFRQIDAFTIDKLAHERLDQPSQMSSLSSTILLEDRENNIWVGTDGGLDRFRANKLISIPVPTGVNYYNVATDDAGEPFVVSLPKGHLFRAGTTDYGPLRTHLRAASAVDGGLLVADSTGIDIRKGGQKHTVPLPADARGEPLESHPGVLAGGTGDFWLTLASAGLFHFDHGTWAAASTLGLPSHGTCCFAVDPHGATWFGNRVGDVVRFQAGKLTRLTVGEPGDVGGIRFIDARDGVMIAGDEAIAVMIHGAFRRLRTRDPELLAGVAGVIVTAHGDRWLNARKGAVHITASAWAQALARPELPMEATLFDSLDGYPGSAQSVNGFPTTAESADGKLWFVGTSGVAWLDPARLSRNTVAPVPSISPPNVAGMRPGPDGSIILPPGSTTLRLDYTAPALAMPDRVQFRYRLDGVDADWQNAGTRRSVFYTNLGPGQYRFRVMAMNEDGVASSTDANMPFVIEPTAVQTTWFKALCLFLLAGLAVAAYRWRMRRLATRHWERFQERLAERERIARTLHDDLMQNFNGLLLFFHTLSQKLAPGDATKTSMDGILARANTVMAAAREEIVALRSRDHAPRDLGAALAEFGQQLQAQHGPRFTLTTTGTVPALTPFAWNEVDAIGREAIFNAYQHAYPSRVDVELGCTRAGFVLLVRDDGRGLDTTMQRDGHFGLTGMRERALGIGGKLTLHNRREGGLDVLLRVPRHRIDGSGTGRHGWIARWLSRLRRGAGA